jgi:hypothetical protein
MQRILVDCSERFGSAYLFYFQRSSSLCFGLEDATNRLSVGAVALCWYVETYQPNTKMLQQNPKSNVMVCVVICVVAIRYCVCVLCVVVGGCYVCVCGCVCVLFVG